MRSTLLSVITILVLASKIYAQDTFSIVAADSTTRVVGSAGASCVDLFMFGITDAGFLGDLLPDTGAINTQAAYLATNQTNARARMRGGNTPAQIISWLSANDVYADPTVRQYGIVGFSGKNLSAKAYTGTNCMNYKNHKTGSINGIYYSIQGNILLGQQIIDSMESKFRKAQGNLSCRLMAALQGAKVIGADTRCATNGTSSLFAFLKVSKPTDKYGNSSFSLSVKTPGNAQIEPIDSLQNIFNKQHTCGTTGINESTLAFSLKVYPDPAGNEIFVRTNEAIVGSTYIITDQLGRQILTGRLTSETTRIDIHQLIGGMYFVQINNLFCQKFIKG